MLPSGKVFWLGGWVMQRSFLGCGLECHIKVALKFKNTGASLRTQPQLCGKREFKPEFFLRLQGQRRQGLRLCCISCQYQARAICGLIFRYGAERAGSNAQLYLRVLLLLAEVFTV